MRHGFGLLIILSALVLVSGNQARADDALAGKDVVRSKNLHEETLLIGEHVYQVTSQTLLRDATGESLQLRDIGVPAVVPANEFVPLTSVLMGRYEAVRVGGNLVLHSLDLIPNPE